MPSYKWFRSAYVYIDLKTGMLICAKNNMKYLDSEERSHLCIFNFWQLVSDLYFHGDHIPFLNMAPLGSFHSLLKFCAGNGAHLGKVVLLCL